MPSSSFLNAHFFIELVVFHIKRINLVLIEGLFVLETSEALLDIHHGKPIFFKLLFCHLKLNLVLTKLLLQPCHLFLEGVCITLVVFKYGNVCLESLVNFFSCAQFGS